MTTTGGLEEITGVLKEEITKVVEKEIAGVVKKDDTEGEKDGTVGVASYDDVERGYRSVMEHGVDESVSRVPVMKEAKQLVAQERVAERIIELMACRPEESGAGH